MQIRVIPFALSLLLLAGQAAASSQDEPAPPAEAAQPATSASTDKPAFKPEELEQMLAPIALYPDDLLTQILMAATYPLEIVMADRWAKANKNLKGDAAAKALEKEDWDASVKSLVNFPDVLGMLSDKLEWTQKLGDAFLGQQKEVLDTIQKLRAKAKEEGKLETDKNQTVAVEEQGSTQIITIESSDPSVVYVPVYDPVVVYGSWPYPAYPPYPYYPPAYGVGVGITLGFAWGYAWGHCDWDDADIDIDVDHNHNFNTNIDREAAKQKLGERGGGSGTWQHDPSHRQGVPYRDKAATQRYGGKTSTQAAQARESFRGRTGAETANRGTSAGGTRQPSASTRDSGSRGSSSRESGARGSSSRASSSGSSSRASALDGVSRGGSSARASSSRGRSSMGGGSRGGGGRGGGRRG